MLWRLPAGLLLAGLAYESLLIARAGLGLDVEAPERWFLGRPGTATLLFRHALGRRVLIEWVPSAPSGFAFDGAVRSLSVPAFAVASARFTGTPCRLGSQHWPSIRIRVAGSLGLAWWPRRLPTVASIRVLPELLLSQLRGAGGDRSGARSGPSAGAGAEVLQLRDYRPGDPPRVIDWKATARVGRLISRDFSEDQHLEIMILIDAGRASGLRSGELDRFGHYVNVAARLAQYAVAQDDMVGVIVFADRPLLECAPDAVPRRLSASARCSARRASRRASRIPCRPPFECARSPAGAAWSSCSPTWMMPSRPGSWPPRLACSCRSICRSSRDFRAPTRNQWHWQPRGGGSIPTAPLRPRNTARASSAKWARCERSAPRRSSPGPIGWNRLCFRAIASSAGNDASRRRPETSAAGGTATRRAPLSSRTNTTGRSQPGSPSGRWGWARRNPR